jgi:uncharacterized protein (TIGR02284 family)
MPVDLNQAGMLCASGKAVFASMGIGMRTQETIRTLNRLIRSCRGAEAFCRASARTRGATQLRTVLRHRAEEWGRYGDELQALVLMLGGEPATRSATGGLARRLWLASKTLVLGSSEALVLEEWQSEQQRVLKRYQEALQGYLARRILRTVTVQAARISQRLEQIESLRQENAVLAPNAPQM